MYKCFRGHPESHSIDELYWVIISEHAVGEPGEGHQDSHQEGHWRRGACGPLRHKLVTNLGANKKVHYRHDCGHVAHQFLVDQQLHGNNLLSYSQNNCSVFRMKDCYLPPVKQIVVWWSDLVMYALLLLFPRSVCINQLFWTRRWADKLSFLLGVAIVVWTDLCATFKRDRNINVEQNL